LTEVFCICLISYDKKIEVFLEGKRKFPFRREIIRSILSRSSSFQSINARCWGCKRDENQLWYMVLGAGHGDLYKGGQ